MLSEAEASVYDRQIRLWGADAQHRLSNSNVLFIGIGGLAAEVCKNVFLAGVKVSIWDNTPVSQSDFSSQFFINQSDIGKKRSIASRDNIAILNPLINVTILEDEDILKQPPTFFSQFRVVCATGISFPKAVELNEICHKLGVYFFYGDSIGFYAYFFQDLVSYSYSYKVDVPNTTNGNSNNSKQPQQTHSETRSGEVKFNSLSKVISTIPTSSFDPPAIYWSIRILWAFESTHGRKPNTADMNEILKLKSQIMTQSNAKSVSALNDTLPLFINSIGNSLSAVCAITGGVLGQEILKVISAKEEPLDNIFLYSAFEARNRPGFVVHMG